MARTDRNWERDVEIWNRHIRRETHESIAAVYGIDSSRVSQIIKDMRGKIPQHVKDEFIQDTAELYAHWIHETAKLVDADPIPAYSNGRPVIGKDGQPVDDHAGRMAAMAMGLRVSESWRKMLGIDAATRIDSDVAVRYVLENVDDTDLT